MRSLVLFLAFLVTAPSLFAEQAWTLAGGQRMLSIVNLWSSNESIKTHLNDGKRAVDQINQFKKFKISVEENKEAFVSGVTVQCNDGSTGRQAFFLPIFSDYSRFSFMANYKSTGERYGHVVELPESCSIDKIADIRIDGKTTATDLGAFIRFLGISTFIPALVFAPKMTHLLAASAAMLVIPSLDQARIRVDLYYPES